MPNKLHTTPHSPELALRYLYHILFTSVWTYEICGGNNASLPGLDLEGHLPRSLKGFLPGMAWAKPSTPRLGENLFYSSRTAWLGLSQVPQTLHIHLTLHYMYLTVILWTICRHC